VAVVLYAALGACTDPPFAVRDATFHGHYSLGFERNDFLACGATFSQRWLVSGELDAVHAQMAEDLKPDAFASVFVRWRGNLSRRGSYGPEGLERQFSITEVLEVRQRRTTDCT
jgi:hypothetical protein